MQRFCENIILFFHKDHFYVQCMDFTQVVLFEVRLQASFFDEYTMEEGDTSNIGINQLLFRKYLTQELQNKILHCIIMEIQKDFYFIRKY